MQKDSGFSLIELLLVVSIILIIAAIAIPNLMRSRAAANEASAVSSLRSLNTAEAIYSSTYNTLGFACSLSTLGPPSSGAPTSAAAGLIDSSLASGLKSGYLFTAGTCSSVGPTVVRYQWSADPATSSTGSRHFCTDETFDVRVDPNTAANCFTIGTPVG